MKMFIAIMIFALNLSYAQTEMREMQLMHLFGDFHQSITIAKGNIPQWEKKVTCYNIGKIYNLTKIIASSVRPYLEKSNKNEHSIDRLLKLSERLDSFCTNKVEKITLKGVNLNSQLKKMKNISDKLFAQLTNQFYEGQNVRFGFDRAKFMFIDAYNSLPTKFETAIALSEIEVDAVKYKPSACLAIGKLVSAYEIFKFEAQRASQYMIPLLNAHDSITELSEHCYNQRGFSKYLRELEKLQEIVNDALANS